MGTDHRLGVLVTIALVAAAPGCEEEDGRPPLQEATEHFDVHARSDVELCDGLLDRLERHFDAVGSFLQISESARFSVYIYGAGDGFREYGCPGTEHASGCEWSDGTMAVGIVTMGSGGGLDVLDHELVHGYMHTIGDPPYFFQEGIANALECGEMYLELSWVDGNFENALGLLEQSAWNAVPDSQRHIAYSTAGAITKFLIERSGVDLFLELYARIPRDATRDEIDVAFEEVYGASAESLFAEWGALPSELRGESCIPIFLCSQDPLPGPAGEDVEFECMARSDETGPLRSRLERTLEVGDQNHFRLTLEDVSRAPSWLRVKIGRCEGEGSGGIGASPYRLTGSFWSHAPPGSYWMRLAAPEGYETTRARLSTTWTDDRWSPLDDGVDDSLPGETRYLEIVPSLIPDDVCASEGCEEEANLSVAEDTTLEWLMVRFSALENPVETVPEVWVCRDDLRTDCLTLTQESCHVLGAPDRSAGSEYCVDHEWGDWCPILATCFTAGDARLIAGHRYSVGWRGVGTRAAMMISLAQ